MSTIASRTGFSLSDFLMSGTKPDRLKPVLLAIVLIVSLADERYDSTGSNVTLGPLARAEPPGKLITLKHS